MLGFDPSKVKAQPDALDFVDSLQSVGATTTPRVEGKLQQKDRGVDRVALYMMMMMMTESIECNSLVIRPPSAIRSSLSVRAT